jgi:hypothetical protein
MIGGIVSAGLPPTRRMTSAFGMSSSGNWQAAVDAERAILRRAAANAEASVVVDVRRADSQPRELSQM